MSELQDTVIIEFNQSGSSVDYIALAEFDDVENVDSTGDVVSSFGPNDYINIWLHLSSNVKLDDIAVTSGTVESTGSGSRERTDDIFFTSRTVGDPSTYESPVIPSATDIEYFGNIGEPTRSTGDLGTMVLTGDDFDNVPYLGSLTHVFPVITLKIKAPDVTLGDDESFPLGIVFYISEV